MIWALRKLAALVLSPLQRIAAIAGIVLLGVAVFAAKFRRQGRDAERARQQRARDKVRRNWDEIDRDDVDVDDAVERLRERAAGD